VDTRDLAALSLADFFSSDNPDPLRPSDEFTAWRKQVTWATSLYEQALVGGPVPRTSLLTEDGTRPILNFASQNYLLLARRRSFQTESAIRRRRRH